MVSQARDTLALQKSPYLGTREVPGSSKSRIDLEPAADATSELLALLRLTDMLSLVSQVPMGSSAVLAPTTCP